MKKYILNLKHFTQNELLPTKFIINNFRHLTVLFTFCIITIFVFSCSNSSTPESGQGQIMVTMVDAPSDYDQVNIVVTRVEVHKSGSDSTTGWVVINNIEGTYNLLALRNGASAILGNHSLDVGHYTQIRLILGTGCNVVAGGMTHSLDVSSGMQTGLKLNHEFDILPDQIYELMLDFNTEHSIMMTGNGQYMLKPVIRVVPMIISGTISGKILPVTALASVNAIRGTDTLTTNVDIFTGSYKLMAVTQGTYSVNVLSGNIAYKDTTITNVIVVARQNTDIGTINLRLK